MKKLQLDAAKLQLNKDKVTTLDNASMSQMMGGKQRVVIIIIVVGPFNPGRPHSTFCCDHA